MDNAADLDLQVVSKQVDPLGDPGGQRLLDGLGINLDVANSSACGQSLNLLLDSSVLGDLSLKAVQGWVIPCAIL